MYKNRTEDGRNNICGTRVRLYWQKMPGRMLRNRLQICCRSKG